jgi:hypothetical protein
LIWKRDLIQLPLHSQNEKGVSKNRKGLRKRRIGR